MTYSAEISRKNPTCIVFLLDQSGSMDARFGEESDTKAKGAADAINKTIHELILKCSKPEGFRDYFDMAIIGYGSAQGYAGPLVGQKFVKISLLNDHPLRLEDRIKRESDGAGGAIELKVRFPIWFEPKASSDTPMCRAMELAYEWLSEWTTDHAEAYPPIIFNITDGEATDGDPEDVARRIAGLSTTDGTVLMFNCHISGTQGKAVLFPSSESELPADEFARKLFNMSSVLPEKILRGTEADHFNVKQGARGFAFNADLVDLVRFLDIGTRAALPDLLR